MIIFQPLPVQHKWRSSLSHINESSIVYLKSKKKKNTKINSNIIRTEAVSSCNYPNHPSSTQDKWRDFWCTLTLNSYPYLVLCDKIITRILPTGLVHEAVIIQAIQDQFSVQVEYAQCRDALSTHTHTHTHTHTYTLRGQPVATI